MPIWKTREVLEQPTITLVRWRILETNRGERHFVCLAALNDLSSPQVVGWSMRPRMDRELSINRC